MVPSTVDRSHALRFVRRNEKERILHGKRLEDSLGEEPIARLSEPKFPAPEGGLFSTAGDMALFHQMLLQKGTLNGQRILSAAGVEEIDIVAHRLHESGLRAWSGSRLLLRGGA